MDKIEKLELGHRSVWAFGIGSDEADIGGSRWLVALLQKFDIPYAQQSLLQDILVFDIAKDPSKKLLGKMQLSQPVGGLCHQIVVLGIVYKKTLVVSIGLFEVA